MSTLPSTYLADRRKPIALNRALISASRTLSADTRIAIPLLIDVVTKEAIWCDMSLKGNPAWVNNVDGNLRGIVATLMALSNLRKPTLYDLLRLHALARGEMVTTSEQADTEFSMKIETHYRQEEIVSDYLA